MNIGYENEYSTDTMTGGPDKRRQLYYQLIQSMKKAESVDIIVSFLMESGVKMLLQELENNLKRGAKIRILTGNYLGITQPSALYLIKRKLGDRVDLRFYCEKGRSFHPKSYIFHYADHSELYIGSSNISRSALTSGIEWNYRFSSKKDPENYAEFFYTFEDLFENHSIIIDDKELKRYSQNWHRPAVAKDLDKYDFEQDTEDTKIKTMYEPRGAQIEALCALEDTRAEGAKKALIQAATGIGKTYLAAFDSKPYEKVLFVAHREEILKQAADSFRHVRNSEDYGFFTGDEKCTDKSVIFASVATLGKSEYLNEKYFTSTVQRGYQITKEIAENSWTDGMTNAKYPKLTYQTAVNNQANTLWIQKKDYLKIRNIQLGYTLPKSVLSKVQLEKVRFYGSLENFFTFTGYKGIDPELDDLSYPTMRQAVIGVNIEF